MKIGKNKVTEAQKEAGVAHLKTTAECKALGKSEAENINGGERSCGSFMGNPEILKNG